MKFPLIPIRTSSQDRSAPKSGSIFDLDLLGEALPSSSPGEAHGAHPPANTGSKSIIDDLDFFSTPSAPVAQSTPKEVVLPADRGSGMQIAAAFVRKDGRPVLDLTVYNMSNAPLSGFAIKFNVNRYIYVVR
jgi:hypothetical protein